MEIVCNWVVCFCLERFQQLEEADRKFVLTKKQHIESLASEQNLSSKIKRTDEVRKSQDFLVRITDVIFLLEEEGRILKGH